MWDKRESHLPGFSSCFRQPRTQTVSGSFVCSQLQAVEPCTAVEASCCGDIHGGLSPGSGFIVLTFMEGCHLELALLSLHSWRVAAWNWLYCPFPCHRTFLGASIKKVGPGSLMGGPGFTWMTTGCQSVFPSRKSSASVLSSLAQGCSTWYCWARPFYSSCFHHRP